MSLGPERGGVLEETFEWKGLKFQRGRGCAYRLVGNHPVEVEVWKVPRKGWAVYLRENTWPAGVVFAPPEKSYKTRDHALRVVFALWFSSTMHGPRGVEARHPEFVRHFQVQSRCHLRLVK